MVKITRTIKAELRDPCFNCLSPLFGNGQLLGTILPDCVFAIKKSFLKSIIVFLKNKSLQDIVLFHVSFGTFPKQVFFFILDPKCREV